MRERREGERKRRKSRSLPYPLTRALGREGKKEESSGERMESQKIRRIEEVEIEREKKGEERNPEGERERKKRVWEREWNHGKEEE